MTEDDRNRKIVDVTLAAVDYNKFVKLMKIKSNRKNKSEYNSNIERMKEDKHCYDNSISLEERKCSTSVTEEKEEERKYHK